MVTFFPAELMRLLMGEVLTLELEEVEEFGEEELLDEEELLEDSALLEEEELLELPAVLEDVLEVVAALVEETPVALEEATLEEEAVVEETTLLVVGFEALFPEEEGSEEAVEDEESPRHPAKTTLRDRRGRMKTFFMIMSS